ncbi:hypothetical protein L2E82_13541 [Cichorium intybus]|uniref:Uncharacterized protein n=1 Tax=Cichorium intybus TaxID=13427 RepID=A0ACB9EYU3_CICIN|nr:hypothetical protein L2E82_13541 [Cichorium intybus]
MSTRGIRIRAISALRTNYKALRSPNGSPRRQAKRQSPSHSNENSLPATRKVKCRLIGVTPEENTPEELQNQATVKSSVLEVLSEKKYSDLYLMETVLDDESERNTIRYA